jgi:hypothetical protein
MPVLLSVNVGPPKNVARRGKTGGVGHAGYNDLGRNR